MTWPRVARLALPLGLVWGLALGLPLLANAAPAQHPPRQAGTVPAGESRWPGWTMRQRLQRLRGGTVVRAPVTRPAAVGAAEVPAPVVSPAAAHYGAGGVPAAGLLNILLLGTDRRPGDGHWRTDTLVLLSIDKAKRRAGMLSIPRDLWVEIPGHGAGRINTADFLGSLAGDEEGVLAKETVAQALGLPVHHFIRVDFRAFMTVVDALGGIDVVVDCPLEDYFLDDGVAGPGPVSVLPGRRRLDGATALRYARSRHSTSDFDRSRRQQRVLRGMVARAREEGLLRSAPRLLASLRDNVQTDLGLPQLLALAALAARYQDLDLRSSQLDGRQLRDWTTPQGARVLVMDPAGVETALSQALAGMADKPAPSAAPVTSVAVLDRSGEPDWLPIAQARMQERGLTPAMVRVGAAEPGSMVYVAAGAEAVGTDVAAALDLGPAAIAPMDALPAALRLDTGVQVTLGSDWALACW